MSGMDLRTSALTQVSCPTHPLWISHHTMRCGGPGLQNWKWFGSCALCASTHLGWAVYQILCEDMSLNEEKKKNLIRCAGEYGLSEDCSWTLDFTLATVACIKPRAIPGAHGRVYTGYSGRVELWVFTGLLGVCQVILCVAQKRSFSF